MRLRSRSPTEQREHLPKLPLIPAKPHHSGNIFRFTMSTKS